MALLPMPISLWKEAPGTATGDSTVCLVGDVKETQIDAAVGITIQAVAGEGCGLKGEYTLASGGQAGCC